MLRAHFVLICLGCILILHEFSKVLEQVMLHQISEMTHWPLLLDAREHEVAPILVANISQGLH